jgi:hypothetical protein
MAQPELKALRQKVEDIEDRGLAAPIRTEEYHKRGEFLELDLFQSTEVFDAQGLDARRARRLDSRSLLSQLRHQITYSGEFPGYSLQFFPPRYLEGLPGNCQAKDEEASSLCSSRIQSGS